MVTTAKRSIQELSIDSKLLYERLLKLAVGEEVTYAELSLLIGRSVRADGPAYSNLQTARRMLKRENRIVIGTVRATGVVRLDDCGASKTGQAAIRTINRAARRGVETLSCVEFDNLPPEEKTRHLAASAALGVTYLCTKQSSVKKIETATGGGQQTLSIANTLELFKG